MKKIAKDKFLLQKQGKRWDGVPVPHVTAKDLDKVAFQYFQKNAVKSKRLDSDILKDSNPELVYEFLFSVGKRMGWTWGMKLH